MKSRSKHKRNILEPIITLKFNLSKDAPNVENKFTP